jgi:squalene synthase HpnC/squalene synthase HpnD
MTHPHGRGSDAAAAAPAGTPAPSRAAAYRHCRRIATTHYENFTVGSWLLPRHLRLPIAAIYAFARTADDVADEGNVPAPERLARLAAWEDQLVACYAGRADHPIFVALADTVRRFAIPIEPFRRLLEAFRQDVVFEPFATAADLRAYCRRSADPVGHLVLALFGYHDAERQRLSDQICTGLQLANFWQDVAVDAARGRLYVPLEDLERFGCTAADLVRGEPRQALRDLLRFEVERARAVLTDGLALADRVDRRLAREVHLFASGGLAILAAIEAQGFDVWSARPVLSSLAKTRLILRAMVVRPTPSHRPPRLEGPAGTDGAPPALGIHGTRLLREAYAYCQEVTRRASSNFYYAFRLLPAERREGLCAVYAFCRFVDDIADDSGRRDPHNLLARWRDELGRVYDGAPTHPIGRALADTVRRFAIAPQPLLDLIRGVELDLTRRRYATFDELYEYCYLVASTVGLVCIEIFGHQHPSAREYAIDLGVAFQLTNILRDVMEDAERGRIYLPLEDLRHFDCREDDLLGGRYSPRVGALMAFECGRARAYYLRASGALAPEDRASLAPAEAMRLIYERLLARIEARHFDVFGPKITLPRYEKVTLALAAWGRAQLAVLHP